MRITADQIQELVAESLKNAYSILGLPLSASDQQIRDAWNSQKSLNEEWVTKPQIDRTYGAAQGVWRFYTSSDNSVFWEIEWLGNTIYTSMGRTGQAGHSKIRSYDYEDEAKAKRAAAGMIKQRLGQGFKTNPTPPVPSPSKRVEDEDPPTLRMGAPGAAPAVPAKQHAVEPKVKGPSGARHGIPKQDTYRVYNWKGKRRTVRVGNKLFGTEPAGALKTGGTSRFNDKDRVRVQRDGDQMFVGDVNSDYTQTWEPMEEVRHIVDDTIFNMLERIGNSYTK